LAERSSAQHFIEIFASFGSLTYRTTHKPLKICRRLTGNSRLPTAVATESSFPSVASAVAATRSVPIVFAIVPDPVNAGEAIE
jgi:ABC-type uncharacterized transport system substrate-binding protein